MSVRRVNGDVCRNSRGSSLGSQSGGLGQAGPIQLIYHLFCPPNASCSRLSYCTAKVWFCHLEARSWLLPETQALGKEVCRGMRIRYLIKQPNRCMSWKNSQLHS